MDNLPDENAKRLSKMSSPLPSAIIEQGINDGWQLDSNARGYVFNGGLDWIDLDDYYIYSGTFGDTHIMSDNSFCTQ